MAKAETEFMEKEMKKRFQAEKEQLHAQLVAERNTEYNGREVTESFEDYIQSRDGVDYLPSSIYLSVVDAKLRTEMGAERMLAEVLEPLKSRYDYILIDTCPSLGI